MFLIVILPKVIFIKNTHGLAYVAFSNISRRLWLGDNAIWRILSIKETDQVFIQAYKPFTTSKTFKNFQSRTIWFDPYHPLKKEKKKKNIKLRSICVLLIKTFIQKLYSQLFYTSFYKNLYSFFSLFTPF